MREEPSVLQFVCFETSLSRAGFVARWEPFAASFLARGIGHVVLAEAEGNGHFAFISRNVWPRSRFEVAFGGALPHDAGVGPVTAVQGGAFSIVASTGMRLGEARAGLVKVLALVRCRQPALSAVTSDLGVLAAALDSGLGVATFVSHAMVRGGRFNAAMEVYCEEPSAERVKDALAARLAGNRHVEEVRVQRLREVLVLGARHSGTTRATRRGS